MLKKIHSISAVTFVTAVLTGCSMSSPDKLPEPLLAGDAQLTILQTTDVHHAGNGAGHATATASANVGSYARISAYVNYVRGSVGHPVVLVDSGDWSMGTVYDLTLAQQPLALFFMDTLKYDCVTLGNHEFDFTPTGLATMLGAAQRTFSFSAPMVASNINLNGNADLAPYIGANKLVAPTRVETLPNGLKIGYIGLMGKSAASAAPASTPVSFTDFSTNFTFIQNLVNDLRNTQGCNVVVALSHSGTDVTGASGEDVDLAKHVTGIDVIASGHNHYPLDARTIANGTWNTQLACAGAYGTNVARIDLIYHAATKNTSLVVADSKNQAMTDANLTAIHSGLEKDAGINFMVRSTELSLNQGLGALFTATFTDFNSADTRTGIYHPIGLPPLQTLEANDRNAVLCPNGMGNLCADSIRNVPNGIVGKVLTAVGGDITKLPSGFDPTFFQVGIVATGVIRNSLPAGAAPNFTDIYNTLPLGISPDQTQAIPVGYPLMSAYIKGEDLKKLCALQLVAQAGLASADYYLNLSGIGYSLKPAESNVFFKYATAASVLTLTIQKATAGSIPAGTAIAAFTKMAKDGGVDMMTAIGTGNAYAIAMGKLNDANLANAAANLGVLGEVAMSTNPSALVVSKAVAAIDTLSGFSPADAACTGGSAPLVDATRYRLAADLYMILMIGAAEAQFGTSITAYRAATGAAILSAVDMPGLMGNRINLDPTGTKMQETKEWMALLLYLTTQPAKGGYFTDGKVGAEYASTPNFAEFGTFGTAVKARNTSYPLNSILPLMTTLGGLTGEP